LVSNFQEFSPSLPIQGCQIFLGTTYQNWKKLPNDPQMYQRARKYNIGP
jgi:hypothetical protein